jgi:hypothetical protein
MSSHPMRERRHQRLWSPRQHRESGPSEICAVGVLEHEGTPTPSGYQRDCPLKVRVLRRLSARVDSTTIRLLAAERPTKSRGTARSNRCPAHQRER